MGSSGSSGWGEALEVLLKVLIPLASVGAVSIAGAIAWGIWWLIKHVRFGW